MEREDPAVSSEVESLYYMNSNPPLAVCLYARVSSEAQEERGTIRSQIDELKKTIAANGDVLLQEYVDDGYSGELLERPALDQLRNDAAKQAWKKVYVLSPDRLARKPHIAGLIIDELQAQSIDVMFVNRPLGNTIEDHLLFGVQSLFAEYEKEKIKERQRRGKLFKARKGLIVGGKAPYGYIYVKDSSTGVGRYETHGSEAAIVRLIYHWYTGGSHRSYRQIAKELLSRGVKTRSGRARWTHAVISSILSDPTYAGTTYYNKRRRVPAKRRPGEYRRRRNTARTLRDKAEWIPAKVPPLVSVDLYEKAQRLKVQNAKQSPRHAKETYLLKNLIRCGECGSALYGAYTINSSKTRYCFYQCSLKAKRDPLPTAHRFTIRRDLVDSGVWNALKDILTSPSVLAARVNSQLKTERTSKNELQRKMESLDRRLEQQEAKRRRTLEAYSEHLLTLKELKSLTEEFNQASAAVAEERAALTNALAAQAEPINLETAREIARTYRDGLELASNEKRRQLVQALVEGVTADRDKLTVSCRLPAGQGESHSHGIAFGSPIRSERNAQYEFGFTLRIRRSDQTKRPRDASGRFLATA